VRHSGFFLSNPFYHHVSIRPTGFCSFDGGLGLKGVRAKAQGVGKRLRLRVRGEKTLEVGGRRGKDEKQGAGIGGQD
jgi:hypothetical protein